MAMGNDAIKLECLKRACEVLGVYQGTVAYRNDVGNPIMPKVDEVLEVADKFFRWVEGF